MCKQLFYLYSIYLHIFINLCLQLDAKYDPNAEQNARLWIEDVTGILLANPGDDVQTIEQLNEWRMTPLGQKEFHKALKDGVIICK